jgi:hypothetical protein
MIFLEAIKNNKNKYIIENAQKKFYVRLKLNFVEIGYK